MPPQVAARMAAVTTKAKATTTTKAGNDDSNPATVPSSAEKLGAHGAKVKHKRRFCRIEGCERIVKSQGLCQRHGAKPRLCKVKNCSKQAQGNFDGMCKSHFKEHKRKTTPIPKVEAAPSPPQPTGASVFDSILPSSVNFFPAHATVKGKMPLVAHLAEGFHGGKPPAWHRNEERKARGLVPVQNPATQLEGWERELVWMEILVLTGVPEVSFRHLARAWGRDKGFHMVLAQFICERHGDVQRKKRKREEEIIHHKNEQNKKSSMEPPNPKRAAACQEATAPKARQQQLLQQQKQHELMKKLSVSPEDMQVVRDVLLTPERKKQIAIATLLRRKNSDKDSKASLVDGNDDQLSLIGADAWDETCYGDANYNEALAADLFNLTPQESAVLMRRLSVGRQVATDDDSSSIYSRSGACGKTFGLSRTGSKDGQQQHGRLQKRDSSASLRSTSSAHVPNTVAVEKRPESERGDLLDSSLTADETQRGQCLSPSSHPHQQHQQYNSQAAMEATHQQENENLQQQKDAPRHQHSLQGRHETTLPAAAPAPAPVPAAAPGAQSFQLNSQQSNSDKDAEPSYKYNHHDFRSLPSPSQGHDKQAKQSQQQCGSHVPQGREQTQQLYPREAQAPPPPPAPILGQHFTPPPGISPTSIEQQFQPPPGPSPDPPVRPPPARLQYPDQSQQHQLQQQRYQTPQQQTQQQQQQQPGQQYQEQQYQAQQSHQQQFQPQPQQQQQQYGQPIIGLSQPTPQSNSQSENQLLRHHHQFQHNHQTHQHLQTHGLGNHQRQHSQQGLNLHGQPQMEAFQQPQQPQGHPLLGTPQPLHQSGGQAGQPHSHILHQRQHSQQDSSVHGVPQVSHGYHQQVAHHNANHRQPSSRPVQNLHHRQHSQQGHLLQGQAQLLHGHQQQQQGQPPSPGSHQNAVGDSQKHSHGMQAQQLQQHQATTDSNQKFQVAYVGQQNSSSQQFHHVSQHSQHVNQAAPNVQRHKQQSHPQFQNRGKVKNMLQKKSESQDLHDYDHRNEHLQAQEDDHMDVDPSHEHHDYGTEVEHEDHDHQDKQLHSVAKSIQNSQADRSEEPKAQSSAMFSQKDNAQKSPDPKSAHVHQQTGQNRMVEQLVQGQKGTQQYGLSPTDQQQQKGQGWDQKPSYDANYSRPSSASYSQLSNQSTPAPSYQGQQAQAREHHHQHEHLCRAHLLELPQLGQHESYANLSGAQQTDSSGRYIAHEQQNQEQQQARTQAQQQLKEEAQFDGSAPQTQPARNQQDQSHSYQSQTEPAYQQEQIVVNSSFAFQQDVVDQASTGGHQVSYQRQQQEGQNGTQALNSFAHPSERTATYQHQEHPQAGQPPPHPEQSLHKDCIINGQFQSHDQLPTQHQDPPQQGHTPSQTIQNAFQHESSSVSYEQQQQPRRTPYHQPAQQNTQTGQNSFNVGYESQPEGHEQTTQHRQAAYQEQAQAQQDLEAAKNAMKGFEQEQQHQGHAEALFELPYTTGATASLRQHNNPVQQQPHGTYQQEGQIPGGSDVEFAQSLADSSSNHQYEQQQEHQDQFQLRGQDFAAIGDQRQGGTTGQEQ